MLKKNNIIEVLKTCFDPEIPVDLWSLGLIYDIKILEKSKNSYNIDILMTLTTPGCSMIDIIANDVKEKIIKIKNVKSVNVNITFDPPWEPSFMNDNAKIKLGLKKNNKTSTESDWE